jgi:DNA-binding MarR family transcriptional regulator
MLSNMDEVEAYRLLIADIYELAGISRRTSEKLANATGQTAARWHVLSVLSDGPRTVPAAARRLGLATQSVQRVVTGLIASGHLEARPNPDHARAPLVALTEQGRTSADELFASSRADREDVVARAGVTAKQLAQTRKVLRALSEALRR